MNSLREKLTSQTGASITYALLLFLVCAVVSSVVLAAATAASGRMSKAVENDQRYYCVTSAAELMKDMILGKTVVVEKKTTTIAGETPTEEKKIDGEEYTSSSELDFVQEAAACYKGFKAPLSAARTIKLTVSGETSLTAKITETLDSSTGRITLDVSNADGKADGSGTYTLTLVFDAEISEKKQKKTSGTQRTVTETTTMKWTQTSIG